MKTICVLMSTYNGKRYLKMQLDSIFKQDVLNPITLFVRDDGSSDNTIEILEEYGKCNGNGIVISRGNNLGSAQSFMELIKQAPKADYYAFCDQDDVWNEDKLQTAISEIGNQENPVLWCSNYSVVDSELRKIKSNAIDRPVLDEFEALYYNNIPGCTMVFNYGLMLELRKLNITNVRMHDIVALNIAILTGKVLYNQNSYIKYRQHGDNVVGYSHKKIILHKWIKDKLQLLANGQRYSMSDYAKEILRNYRDYLDNQQVITYSLIADTDNSWAARIKLINSPFFKVKKGRTGISIKLNTLLGLM